MNISFRNLVCFVWLLALMISPVPAAAQTAAGGAVVLQATGQFARGGEFEGTVTINKFDTRVVEGEEKIFAIGFVEGTLTRGNRRIGSVFKGPVSWPVAIKAGNVALARGSAPSSVRPIRVGWTLAQAPEVCSVVQIALGPLDVNLLGIVVSLSPVAFDLEGIVGTPLGELVCQVSGLLLEVAKLVGVLNGILGLVTGLLGGLTGGLGGIVPTI